jgi:hypothetical protein
MKRWPSARDLRPSWLGLTVGVVIWAALLWAMFAGP